jgi:hypothetical protein
MKPNTVKGYIRSTTTTLKSQKEGPDIILGKIVLEFPMTKANMDTYLAYVRMQSSVVEFSAVALQGELEL